MKQSLKPTLDEIKELASERPDAAVSIYVPTVTGGAETRQNPIRYRNLLDSAAHRLDNGKLAPEGARRALEAGRQVADDEDFWRHRDEGVALFLTADGARHCRLPEEPSERVVVSDRFHLKPLLKAAEWGRCFVLALSRNSVRLFMFDGGQTRELDLGDTPGSLQEALWLDDPERSVQQHTTTPRAEGREAIHHGHGGTPGENEVRNLQRFCGAVARGVSRALDGADDPLVLACDVSIDPVYRAADSYPRLLDEGIPGTPDRLSADELRNAAYPLVADRRARERRRIADDWNPSDTATSSDLEQVLERAWEGRVGLMFACADREQWGRFDPDRRAVKEPAEEAPIDDLVDVAAAEALRHGADVYTVDADEMPVDDALVAARLRA